MPERRRVCKGGLRIVIEERERRCEVDMREEEGGTRGRKEGEGQKEEGGGRWAEDSRDMWASGSSVVGRVVWLACFRRVL